MLVTCSCGAGPKLMNCKQQQLHSCHDKANVKCQVHGSPVLVWLGNDTSLVAFSIFDLVGTKMESSDGLFVAFLTNRTGNVTESVIQFNFTTFDVVNISCGNVETGLRSSCVVAKPGKQHNLKNKY